MTTVTVTETAVVVTGENTVDVLTVGTQGAPGSGGGGGGDVESVFGRTGAIVAENGDYNTSQVTENTNLYHTTGRARSAAVVNTLGGTETDQAPSVASVNTALGGKANTSHTHTASEITDFSTAADARINAARGANNGIAALDSGGKVPSSQLPSYVDDVEEYANFAALPVTGETGKIYILATPYTSGGVTSSQFRWSGSAYAPIIASPGSTDSVTEGSTNLYFTAARAIGSILTGFTAGAGTVSATDTILQAIQKIVGNIAGLVLNTLAGSETDKAPSVASVNTALGGKANTSHTHAISDVTGLQTALDGKLDDSQFSGLSKITVGTSAPGSPSTGDLWVDTN